MINVFPTPTHIVSKPFLRWVGGKTRLLPILRKALPNGKRLLEPFVGSGAVFLGTRYDSYILNDANPDLIHLFCWIQRDVERFIRLTRPLFKCGFPDEDAYVRIRDRFNSASHGSLERASLFLWLNRACFNGVCRYNSQGAFNVPRGDDKGEWLFPEDEIRAFHAKARIAEFRLGDGLALLEEAADGDVVYADPPYLPRSPTASFVRYTDKEFGTAHHKALADACRRAAERGATVVLSNHCTKDVCQIYHDARIVAVRLTHLVGARGDARSLTAEALLVYGDTKNLPFWFMSRPAKHLLSLTPHTSPTPQQGKHLNQNWELSF